MKASDLTCPGCGKRADDSMNPDELEALAVGDLTICPVCGRILVIDLGGQLREAAATDLEGLPTADREFLAAIAEATAKRRPH